MNIAIVGASGFVGEKLVDKLLNDSKHTITAISKRPTTKFKNNKRIIVKECDIFNTDKLSRILDGCEVVYYLVHMMSVSPKKYDVLEIKAAKSFCMAARNAKIRKVIYLGGLGDNNSHLSQHLKSRQKSGKILGSCLPTVIEFRASIIIGSGSSSFEIIKSIVSKTSFMILPKWSKTLVQPICIVDIQEYLITAISLNLSGHQIIEIGGPKIMTYKELLLSYASYKNIKLKIFTIDWLPRWPAKFWLRLFVDKKYYSVAIAMIDSLENDVVVNKRTSQELFNKISPKNIETEFG